MHQPVEDDCCIDVPSISGVNHHPVDQEDGAVVVEMQEGKARPALGHHNKEGIRKIEYFGEIEYPNHGGYVCLCGIERIAQHLSFFISLFSPPRGTGTGTLSNRFTTKASHTAACTIHPHKTT